MKTPGAIFTLTSGVDLPKHPRRENGRFIAVPLTPASGYFTRHDKVKYLRGSARQFLCSCGQQARHWATLHGRDGLDVWSDYQPMCARCHMFYDGTSICLRHGEDVFGAKLTRQSVLEMRELRATGSWTLQRLADRYGVSQTAIFNVVGRKTTWRWLTEAPRSSHMMRYIITVPDYRGSGRGPSPPGMLGCRMGGTRSAGAELRFCGA